jgi:uncharacterized protein (TIGR00299 family) protein
MKVAYFDLIAGASGDMILGALIDAGLPEETLKNDLAALKLTDFKLVTKQVNKQGFRATKVDVLVKEDVPERHLSDIEIIITSSDLSSRIQGKAIEIFRMLGGVEAGIHSSSLEKVHLHELGGVDTIVDVVGTLLGLETLGISKVYTSPVPLGRGFVRGAHGQIPLPAPATVALLKGVPVTGSEIGMELVTPTGAVLLKMLTESFGQIPAMRLEAVGYGAGGRDLPIPNLLRVLIGENADPGKETIGTLILLETNIDDMNPEFYLHVMDKLFEAGALDVFYTPILMKKNRPATLLQVLAHPEEADGLRRILFEETSTLGIRQQYVERYALEREFQVVETIYGQVRIKVASLGEGKVKFSPEFEDCRILAGQHKVPIHEIYLAAETAYRNFR